MPGPFLWGVTLGSNRYPAVLREKYSVKDYKFRSRNPGNSVKTVSLQKNLFPGISLGPGSQVPAPAADAA